jgi:hypothetical protein
MLERDTNLTIVNDYFLKVEKTEAVFCMVNTVQI